MGELPNEGGERFDPNPGSERELRAYEELARDNMIEPFVEYDDDIIINVNAIARLYVGADEFRSPITVIVYKGSDEKYRFSGRRLYDLIKAKIGV